MAFKPKGQKDIRASAGGPSIPRGLDLTPEEVAELEAWGGTPPDDLNDPLVQEGLSLGNQPFLCPAGGGGWFFNIDGPATRRALAKSLQNWPRRMPGGAAEWRQRVMRAAGVSRPGLYYLDLAGSVQLVGKVKRPLGLDDGLVPKPGITPIPTNASFLKWPGGKTLLCPVFDHLWPAGTRLVEPFMGGGSIFLNTVFDSYLLADMNEALVGIYTALRHFPDEFMRQAQGMFTPKNNTKGSYARLKHEFNSKATDPWRKAVLFVYLNRHCFNGLVRYNKKDIFNVAFGQYKKPEFPTEAMRFFAAKLKDTPSMEIKRQGVWETLAEVRAGDVVYCDPPYLPLTATANFAQFGAVGLSLDEHTALAKKAEWLRDKMGVPVLISNHDTSLTRSIYARADQIITGGVHRAIAAKGGSRQPAAELIAAYWPK